MSPRHAAPERRSRRYLDYLELAGLVLLAAGAIWLGVKGDATPPAVAVVGVIGGAVWLAVWFIGWAPHQDFTPQRTGLTGFVN